MTPTLFRILLYYCSMYHVDPYVVQSIIEVESSWKENSVGTAGEVGLMQLHPKYFAHNVDYLKDPENNLRLGIQYLAKLKKECPHKVDNTYVICYNIGTAGAAKVKHPKLFPYYKNVMKAYRKIELARAKTRSQVWD